MVACLIIVSGPSFVSLNRNFEINLGPDLELDNKSLQLPEVLKYFILYFCSLDSCDILYLLLIVLAIFTWRT